MSLKQDQQLMAEGMGTLLTVKRKLGEGGQGTVYLVDGPHGSHAVKWYNPQQSTDEQRAAIRELVKTGPPRGPAGQRFIWPIDLVTIAGARQFGYAMPVIDKGRYAELGEVWARRKPAMGLNAQAEASFQIVNSYRALHLSGRCYRDISRGNLMFDPSTGDVLICDNDNVGVNRQSSCQVWGTPEYMAPELVRGDERHPSTDTDLHSLAVLLFQLWMWHHPLHGEMEYQIRMWDRPAFTKVYGTSPVFVYDPSNRSNRLPNDPAYQVCERRWQICPKPIQALFVRSFTKGLHAPGDRVTEGQWQEVFLQIKDNCVSCSGCKAVNLWDATLQALHCWNCKAPIRVPPKLLFEHPSGKTHVLLYEGAKIRRRHVDPFCPESVATDVIGEVVQNPANPAVWGIRNLTNSPWAAWGADGQGMEVAPARSVPLSAGIRVNMAGKEGTLMP
jgi:DNA-binding helix-hairpin-helix protein with protein kinase domain